MCIRDSAHGDPHIGVKDIGTLGSLGGVLLKGQGGTGFGGNGLTLCDQGGIRLILFGGAGGEVQALSLIHISRKTA